MKEIVVHSENKIGALASVAELLGSYGVNIEAISAYGDGDSATFRIVTEDSNTASKHLSRLPGMKITDGDVLLISLENRPGELGKIARKLANKNVNLEVLYLISTTDGITKLAIRPTKDDLEKAKEALGIKV